VNLEQMVDDWLRAARRQGSRPGTEVAYGWALKIWLKLEAERGIERPDQITAEDVEAFQDWLIDSGKSRSSQRIASSALRVMLQWAAAKRLVAPELHLAVAKVRVPRGQPRPLDEGDLKRLLLHLLPVPPRISVGQARDRALILYLLGTTSRISEALQVTERDWEHAWVVQKGGSQQALLSPPMVVEAVKLYLARRGPVASEFLWTTLDTNRPLRRITPEGVRAICNRLAMQAGIPHFSPHQIRHTAASMLIDREVPAEVVSAQMGHRDMSSLNTYAKVSPRRRQAALSSMQSFLEETIEEAQPKGKAKRAEPEPVVATEAPIEAVGTGEDQRAYLDHLIKEVEGELMRAHDLTTRLAALHTGPSPSQSDAQLRVLDDNAPRGRQPGYSEALISESGVIDIWGKQLDVPPSGRAKVPMPMSEPSGGVIDHWRDQPGAIELRIVFSPTQGVAFEMFGDELGIRQGFEELAGLISSNPDLPWLHA
jgi:integrase/recombinase XerC